MARYTCKNTKRRELIAQTNINCIDYIEVLRHKAAQPAALDRPLGDVPYSGRCLILICCLRDVSTASLKAQNVSIRGGLQNVSVVDRQIYCGTFSYDVRDRSLSLRDSANTAMMRWTEDEWPGLRGALQSQSSWKNILLIETYATGDLSNYRLALVQDKSRDDSPPFDKFDPRLNEVEFSFQPDASSAVDCAAAPVRREVPPPEPRIDYLAKDYGSFRRLMLDRLSVVLPSWSERNPADLGNVLVELLAYTADRLSYYQDAVATEAYLGTARQRISVRRHARLLGYHMHEGCNARTLVHIEVSREATLLGPNKAVIRFLSRCADKTVLSLKELEDALSQRAPLVFEAMHEQFLTPAHNRILLYTWGEESCCLPQGATNATLLDEYPGDGALKLKLKAGDILILEDSSNEDAPPRRHPVRLSRVGLSQRDQLTGASYVEVEWFPEDALPFSVCVKAARGQEAAPVVRGSEAVEEADEVGVQPFSLLPTPLGGLSAAPQPAAAPRRLTCSFLGNIVLADHGHTVAPGQVTLTPPTVPADRPYRPRIGPRDLTYAAPYDDKTHRALPVSSVLHQDPTAALPCLQTEKGGWTARRDLLGSGPGDRHFVVEIDDQRRASLRFGDGALGARPEAGSSLSLACRTGNGHAGNIGAGVLRHAALADQDLYAVIRSVSNPLPGVGGVDPEPVEQVRSRAPQAFRVQRRAITNEDYAAAAERFRDVLSAVATRYRTGSWFTIVISVERIGGRPVDADFRAELRAHLEPYRLPGHELVIAPPTLVPLDVYLTVHARPGYLRGQLKVALLQAFSSGTLPDGQRGFFHPDNFSFAQPVYLSQIVAAAMQVPGVAWVDASPKLESNRFRRLGHSSTDGLRQGVIPIGRLEIARLDNDPRFPGNGRLDFDVRDGL